MLARTLNKLAGLVKKKSWALDRLDKKLARFIPQTGGFFIEAGANDGVEQSNTLFFERYRHWTGLLIEPIPELYAKCVVNRPHCVVENAALVSLDYTSTTIEMRHCNLMSLVVGAMKSQQAEDEHIRVGAAVQGMEPYNIQVAAKPLSMILDKLQIQHVDLLSLDVEGFELQALKGLDFSRHRPEYMLIEARFRDEIEKFLDGRYVAVAEMSSRDILYRVQSN